MRRSWKIQLGSLILTLLGVIIYRYWAYEFAVQRVEKAVEIISEGAQRLQPQAIKLQRPSPPIIEKPMSEIEQREARRKEAFEKAFDTYYTPPKECEYWKSDKHMVECVNHRIRVRKAFQKEYDADLEIAERSGDNWVR